MKPILALVVLAVLLFPTATIAQFGSPSYRCDATRKYYCVANEGCKQIPATTFARMNMQNRMYSRCDRNGCDDYSAAMSVSGQFLMIDVSGRGLTAKISLDCSAFHETVSLGHEVYISFGPCKSDAAPR